MSRRDEDEEKFLCNRWLATADSSYTTDLEIAANNFVALQENW